MIDFPQMVSVSHANAEELFDRDVDGVDRFFARKIGYLPDEDPENEHHPRLSFQQAVAAGRGGSIDEGLRASGFKKEHQDALDRFITSRTGDSEEDEDEEEGSSSAEEENSDNDLIDDDDENASTSSSSGGGNSDEDDEDDSEELESGSEEEENDEDGASGRVCRKMRDLNLEEEGDEADPSSSGNNNARVSTVKMKAPNQRQVQRRVNTQQKAAAKRAGMAKASRNASKSKNKGKRKGADDRSGGGSDVWG